MPYTAQHAPVLTLTTGPVDAYPAILRGLGRPVLYDYDPAFQLFYEEVVRKAAHAMRTQAMPLILHGEPVLALEAGAASLIGREDVVLNLVSGVYGKGFGFWAKRYCRELIEITVPYDDVIDPDAVDHMLKKRPDIAVVAVCHHDTPSGTLNPLNEIGQVVAARGKCLLVDAVSSFGGMDVDPGACAAGVFVTGPNKCLGCPPGLSLVAVSEQAWRKIEGNPDAPRDSVLSLLDWKEAWRHDQPFPFTPSVAEVNGLDAALDLYLAEGPENVWARHAATAQACRAGVLALGLALWPVRQSITSPTATAVRTPEGVDEALVRAEARARYGVVFASGRAETLGKLTRIGHMGPTAHPIHAVTAVAALGGALEALGHRVDVGAGVAAALATIV